MRKVAHLPEIDETTPRALVAAEVRGHLAKRRIPTYKLSEYLSSGESRGYWQRRISGELALDIDDLTKLSELLGVRIADFFNYEAPNPVGPTGIEPMTSTVEYGRLADILRFPTERLAS